MQNDQVLFMKRMRFRNKRRNIGFVGQGGGRKVSLKALCKQYLNKNIQSSKGPDGQIVGHSSVEDAIAAMQLLQLQLKWEEERNRKLGISVPSSMTQFAVYDGDQKEEKTQRDGIGTVGNESNHSNEMGMVPNPNIAIRSANVMQKGNPKKTVSPKEAKRKEQLLKEMRQKKKEIMLYSRNPRMAMKQKRERMMSDPNRKRPRDAGGTNPDGLMIRNRNKRPRIESSKMRFNPRHMKTEVEASKPKMPVVSKEDMLSSLFGEEPSKPPPVKGKGKVKVQVSKQPLSKAKTRPPPETAGSLITSSTEVDPFQIQSDDDSSEEMAIMPAVKPKAHNQSKQTQPAMQKKSVSTSAPQKSVEILPITSSIKKEVVNQSEISEPMKATIMIGGKAVEIDLKPDMVKNLLAGNTADESAKSIPTALKPEPAFDVPENRGIKRKLDAVSNDGNNPVNPSPTKKVKLSATKLKTRKTTPIRPQTAVRTGGAPRHIEDDDDPVDTQQDAQLNIACDSHSDSSDSENQSDSDRSVRSRSPSFSPSPAFSEQLSRINSILGGGVDGLGVDGLDDDEMPPPPPPILNTLNISSSDTDERRKRKERNKKLRKKAKRDKKHKKRKKEKKERKQKKEREKRLKSKQREIKESEIHSEIVQISTDPHTATAPRLTPTTASRYEYQYKPPSSHEDEDSDLSTGRSRKRSRSRSKSKSRASSPSKKSKKMKDLSGKAKNTVLEWCHDYLTPYFKKQKITRKEYSAICKKSVDKIVGSHKQWTEKKLKSLQTKERKKAMVLIKAYYKKHTHSS